MAASLPVVVTAVGGVPEVVTDRRHGRLVPFGDVDAAADAVCEVLTQPRRAAEWGEEGRRHVLESFSISRMSRQLESLYLRILEPEPERRGTHGVPP
jgi:glycosyltransferase involved in cell wall biosynthesis